MYTGRKTQARFKGAEACIPGDGIVNTSCLNAAENGVGQQHDAACAETRRAAALELVFTRGYEPLQELNCTSLALCNACRQAVPVKLTFTDDMPHTLRALFFPSSATTVDQSNSNATLPRTHLETTAPATPPGYGNTSAGGSRSSSAVGNPSLECNAARSPRRQRDNESWASSRVDGSGSDDSVARGSEHAGTALSSADGSTSHGGFSHEDMRNAFADDGLSPRSRRPPALHEEQSRPTRVEPYRRVSRVVWFGRTSLLEHVLAWPSCVEVLSFPNEFDEEIERVRWPSGLRELTIREGFDHPIQGITQWPNCLEQISLGLRFNHPIEGVRWPEALRCLSLGPSFNHPLREVVWPSGLREIVWGNDFNQPIEEVEWPESLEGIRFGNSFDQPVEMAAFPAGMLYLSFGDAFNHPVEGLSWPIGVSTLTFGRAFNQKVADTIWPTALREVSFGYDFNQTLQGTTWPTSLRRVAIGFLFNQPLDAVSWPPELQQLSFGESYDLPIDGIAWPPGLTQLDLGDDFNHPLDNVVFPAGLEQLYLSAFFDQPLEDIRLPEGLKAIDLGLRFNRPVDRLALPMGLEIICFGRDFNQDVSRVQWPQNLRKVSFGRRFVRPLQGMFWPPANLCQVELNSKYHSRHPIDESVLPEGCCVIYGHASGSDY